MKVSAARPPSATAVEVLEHSDQLRDDPRLLAWAAMGPLWLREANTGQALADRALAVARRKSAVGVLPFVLTHVALVQAATDRWAEAQAGFYEAIDLARETGQRTELAASMARLAWLEARQGRSEQSRQHATEALSLSRELGLGVCEVWSIAALGDLELGLGHPEAALAHFEEQQAVLRSRGIGDVDLSPVPELVEIYLRLGRIQEAAEAAAGFDRDARAKAQPWALARAATMRRAAGWAGPVRSSFRYRTDRARPGVRRLRNRPHVTSPVAPGCDESGTGSGPASSFASRSTSSTASAPTPGRKWPGPSSPPPARPRESGI